MESKPPRREDDAGRPARVAPSLNRRALLRGGAVLGAAWATRSGRALGQAPSPSGNVKVPIRILVLGSRDAAARALAELRRGADFAALARSESLDPTASQGGYLGLLDPNDLRPELASALRGLAPGEFSPIVPIPEGFAILLIEPAPPSAVANAGRLAALGRPGAVRYGPDVDGLNTESALITDFPGKPAGWNASLVTIAAVHQQVDRVAIAELEKLIAHPPAGSTPQTEAQVSYLLAELYAFHGEMAPAIAAWEKSFAIAKIAQPAMLPALGETLGIAYLHKAEMDNEVYRHPGDRCLFPMPASLRFPHSAAARAALAHFAECLRHAPDAGRPDGALELKWLLDLAARLANLYPAAAPDAWRLSLDYFRRDPGVGRFRDVAPAAGLDFFSFSGGLIVDDFRPGGRFDIIVSSFDCRQRLRYFQNDGDGRFTERGEDAGLSGQLGGLNLVQADYDNDGNLDVLVLRGAWEHPQPLSLLRNDGRGNFTDVTRHAGLGDLFATQTAVWADVNNDGLLDLFVGNEQGPSRLYLNKGDGTFEDVSVRAGVHRIAFTKSVVAGDFDNDGWVDFHVGNLNSENFLYRNNRDGTFSEVAAQAGVQDPLGRTFASWFFDYDNDGWLDLFVTSYYVSVDETVRTYLGLPHNAPPLRLFHNQRDGTFRDVAAEVGLDKVFMPMGANFGDVDNDGFLDMYLGTGNPSYGTLVPNVLLRNLAGRRFADITASSGTGDLHKGHAVVFADLRNNGRQDLLAVIGGATPGDQHAFRCFRNPGGPERWISLKLVGVKSNRSALGARVEVAIRDRVGARRSFHRVVGGSGSFGANPLRLHFGLGDAASIEEIVIDWPASRSRQVFRDVAPGQFLEIHEFAKTFQRVHRPLTPLGGASGKEDRA